MATLRQIEERDSKGNTTRLNATVTFKQDPNVRQIVGRSDWRLEPNPNYHPPITAQVQNGKVLFFEGTPDTSSTRAMAKEISLAQVPEYIVRDLKAHPIRVREARPTVYEVKIATIGDVEVTTTEEMPNDGQSVTIEPVAPNLTSRRGGRPAVLPEAPIA